MKISQHLKQRLSGLLVFALIGALIVAGFYGWILHGLPAVQGISAGLALPSTQIYDRHGRLLYEITPDGTGRNTVVPVDALPQHCVNALIAVEDSHYYAHPGVSLRGVLRAAWLNLRGGEVIAGGSTITQQVVRNLLLDPEARAERTVRRKLREIILAVQLERAHNKDAILGLWLNQIDFGNLAFGIDAAARAYFGKDATALSLAECALLIGIPQSPAAYDPLTHFDTAKLRQQTVLRLMHQHAMISPEQAALAGQEPLQLAPAPYPIQAPHAVLAVWAALEAQFPDALTTSGLIVTTTIDLDWHNAAQDITRRQLALINDPSVPDRPVANANNAALVALDPQTGAVRVLIGSPNYFDQRISGAINLALTPRQPGSTLKPFTYALAMNPTRIDPLTPASMLIDVRTPFVTRRLESYVPANFDLREHGLVTVREALGSSYNIPVVRVLEQVGVDALIQLMSDLGVTSLAENPQLDLAVTLGGGEVRLYNLTAAYGAIANGGRRVQPYLIQQVTTPDGAVLYQAQPTPAPHVLDERIAFLLADMLSDDAARIPGFGANSVLNIGRPAAVKTGTTTDLRDNWVIGTTPELTVGVWVGNTDYTPMIGVTGLSGAGPIWHQAMRTFLKNTPESRFPIPDGVQRATVCALSGLLPTAACTQTRSEWFVAGTVPTEPDTLHQRYVIDSATGYLADENTPPSRRVEQVYVVLPPEAREWGRRNGLPEPPTAPPNTTVEGLRLRSPDAHTVYEISPSIPREHQRLQLLAAVPANTEAVRYRINGQVVAEIAEPPFSAWWALQVGEWRVDAEVLTPEQVHLLDPVPFRVIPYQPPAASFNRP